MKNKRKASRMWTKEDFREFLSLWESKTATELAEYFGTSNGYIYYIAKRFRDEGYPLTKKKSAGVLSSLIREVIVEAGGRPRKN